MLMSSSYLLKVSLMIQKPFSRISSAAFLFTFSLWCSAHDSIQQTYDLLATRKQATILLKDQMPLVTTDIHESPDMYVSIVADTFIPRSFVHMTALESSLADIELFFNNVKFTGNEGQHAQLCALKNGTLIHSVYMGIGSLSQARYRLVEKIRRVVVDVIKIAHAHKKQHIDIIIADDIIDHVSTYELAREITTTALIACYHFDQFLTLHATSNNTTPSLSLVNLPHPSEVNQGIQDGYHIGYAVNQARYWADLPPCTLTPRYMAHEAERIAAEHDLRCTIFDEEQIKEMGLGGIHAVARGSQEPCRFIILEYHTNIPDAPTIALVGKGITFDSGGISIKPSANMEEMKFDMAGAAAVVATMQLVAYLKPTCNVIGLTPFTENMPSGSAVKPSDIVTFYNGVTAEIKNTDAEGRLILADALAYAVKHYQPSLMIDIATLTGACLYALGKPFAGLLSTDDILVSQLLEAAQNSGDYLWRLPLTEDYMGAVRSNVADIANLGSPSYAGATTAACFLKHFVGEVPWAHLDIAGPAWDVPLSYYKPGGTGFGVRLFAEFLVSYK
jgi:leucyl aminopeptidase